MASCLNVSRETLEQLEHYAELLRKWGRQINLVSKRDLDALWTRHIEDSAQIHQEMPGCRSWLDLGSGGGLPGLVIAILRRESGTEFVLVESDARKCAFLRTVSRELDLGVTILSQRIETVPSRRYNVISARALASLANLCRLSERFGSEGSIWIFPKGENAATELAEARESWRFDVESVPSRTNPLSVLLKLRNVHQIRSA